MKKPINWKERHVYYFMCLKCKLRRYSFKKTRAKNGICRKCRRNEPVPGQDGLFQ